MTLKLSWSLCPSASKGRGVWRRERTLARHTSRSIGLLSQATAAADQRHARSVRALSLTSPFCHSPLPPAPRPRSEASIARCGGRPCRSSPCSYAEPRKEEASTKGMFRDRTRTFGLDMSSLGFAVRSSPHPGSQQLTQDPCRSHVPMGPPPPRTDGCFASTWSPCVAEAATEFGALERRDPGP
jgi:hypothetical protein